MTTHFYDTSSLLLRAENLFADPNEYIAISSVTLQELEEIKTNNNKSPDVKCAARRLLASMEDIPSMFAFFVITFDTKMLEPILQRNLEVNNDMRILATAIWFNKEAGANTATFITNDLAQKHIAKIFFGANRVSSVQQEHDSYQGYKEVILNEEEMANFYSHMDYNTYDLYINQYLIIRNENKEVVDKLKWNGEKHIAISYSNFDSRYFGKVKPYKNDPYQAIAADSLDNNKVTMLRGPAGSGKSYLAIGYLLSQLENHKIDKIIVFCNTVAAKGAARLGYYPGSRDEKLLDSQIGTMLAAKLGDRVGVEQMIQKGQLVLLPLADIRGFDTTGMKAGIYITEAQNLDIALMKLALQRIGEDSICIIDGDFDQQVDDVSYEGSNNGMRRASKILRGSDIYGEIELKKIHRSKLAMLVNDM